MDNKLLLNLNIKKREQSGGISRKLSPMSEKYRLYLQKGGKKSKGSFKKRIEPKKIEPKKIEPKKIEPKKIEPKKIEPKKIQLERNQGKSKGNQVIKIIHQKEKKSKHKYTRKKPSKIKNIKDINEIEKQIEQSKKNEKTKPDIKRSLVKQVKRNLKRAGSKKNSKRNKKGSKGSRKIKIRKHKRVSEKDIQKMQKHIESIRTKKTNEIKKELEEEGIQVTGKSKRLLKDIYLYSKVCGINIRHEK